MTSFFRERMLRSPALAMMHVSILLLLRCLSVSAVLGVPNSHTVDDVCQYLVNTMQPPDFAHAKLELGKHGSSPIPWGSSASTR